MESMANPQTECSICKLPITTEQVRFGLVSYEGSGKYTHRICKIQRMAVKYGEENARQR